MSTKSNILEEAKKLAEAHRKMDPQTHVIRLYSDENDERIKLLEVSHEVATSGEKKYEPFFFENDVREGVTHPIEIILLSDEEWEEMLAGEKSLPDGWLPEGGIDI